MNYLELFKQLDEKTEEKETETDITICEFCGSNDIVLDNCQLVCRGCGIVKDNNCQSGDAEFNDLERVSVQTNVFIKPKTYVSGGNKLLERLQKWSNGTGASREMEANTCYGLIKSMILQIIPDMKENNCLGEKVLHKAKLFWFHLYMDKNIKKTIGSKPDKAGSTRGEPRRCLFIYCIIKALESQNQPVNILDLFEVFNSHLEDHKKKAFLDKYNKHLITKLETDDKTFVSDKFIPYLKIINKYRPDITLTQLVEKYNINKKNKIEKRKGHKHQRININDSSMIKTISYMYISEFVNKTEGKDLFDTSVLTIDKAIRLII